MGVAFCESGAPEDHRDVWTEISWLRSQALYREQHKIVCRHFLFCCITYHVGLRTSCKDISCSFLISSTLAEMMGVPKSPSSTSKSPISPRCLQHPAAGCGRGCGYWACPAKRWPPSCWLGWCMKLWMGWRLRQVDGCRHLHFLWKILMMFDETTVFPSQNMDFDNSTAWESTWNSSLLLLAPAQSGSLCQCLPTGEFMLCRLHNGQWWVRWHQWP